VPAVVLLDLNLPQVSGFGVLEWIRNHPDFAKLPVVVFSSSTREDDRVKRELGLGANEFVAKPSSGLKFGEVVEMTTALITPWSRVMVTMSPLAM
jgi:CheY-like chemotaxis protein